MIINKKLAVFDLDYTLLKINSHYMFTKIFLNEKSISRHTIFKLFSLPFLNKAVSFLFKIDLKRSASFWLLKKYDKQALKTYARKIFCDLSIVNDDVYCLLNNVRKKGYILILATATPDFIAEVFQKMFLFEDVICTVVNNGKIETDAMGNKVKFIQNKYKNHVYSLFVSDNEEDLNEIFDVYIYVKYGKLFKKTSSKEIDLCL